MEVSYPAHSGLGFHLSDIANTIIETADQFITIKNTLNARVFLPSSHEPLPTVIVFHVYGDTQNLLTYRTVVCFAELEAQSTYPCIVIAPIIESPIYPSASIRRKVLDGAMAYIDKLSAFGQVDESRIYVMGTSFGGMIAFEIAERFSERIEAVLAIRPALNYALETIRFSLLSDVPIMICHAKNDETFPAQVSLDAASFLRASGNASVILRVYSDTEMEIAGARHDSFETYGFHHVELAILSDAYCADWLFIQHLPSNLKQKLPTAAGCIPAAV